MVALSLQKLCDVLKQRDIESETLEVCVRERESQWHCRFRNILPTGEGLQWRR